MLNLSLRCRGCVKYDEPEVGGAGVPVQLAMWMRTRSVEEMGVGGWDGGGFGARAVCVERFSEGPAARRILGGMVGVSGRYDGDGVVDVVRRSWRNDIGDGMIYRY